MLCVHSEHELRVITQSYEWLKRTRAAQSPLDNHACLYGGSSGLVLIMGYSLWQAYTQSQLGRPCTIATTLRPQESWSSTYRLNRYVITGRRFCCSCFNFLQFYFVFIFTTMVHRMGFICCWEFCYDQCACVNVYLCLSVEHLWQATVKKYAVFLSLYLRTHSPPWNPLRRGLTVYWPLWQSHCLLSDY